MNSRLLWATRVHLTNALRDTITLLRPTSRHGEHPAHLVDDYKVRILMNDLQKRPSHLEVIRRGRIT